MDGEDERGGIEEGGGEPGDADPVGFGICGAALAFEQQDG